MTPNYQQAAEGVSEMKIVELVSCKLTLPKQKKLRQSGVWNLETNKTLREAIEECLASGVEVLKVKPGGMLYHVKPEYPLVESAMQKPENAGLLKVSVIAYLSSEHLGVNRE